MENPIVELTVDTRQLVTAAALTGTALKGLTQVAGELEAAIDDAFTISGYKDYLKTVRRFGKGLTDELLTLQLSFGTMKAAIADACAPLAAVFVPRLNEAIAAVTRFAGYVQQFFRGMLIGITGRDALAESAQKAAEAEDALTESTIRSGSALRASLMAFDQINRLNGGSGGGSALTGSGILPEFRLEEISPRVQAVVDKVMKYLKPLLEIDFAPLKKSLQGLWEQFREFGGVAAQALEALWFQVLTPFVAWVAEKLAPALVDGFARHLQTITALLQPLMAGIGALWQALRPVVDYIGQQVLTALEDWQLAVSRLGAVFQEKSPKITGIMQNLATAISAAWSAIRPVLDAMTSRFRTVFDQLSAYAAQGMGQILSSLYSISSAVSGAFTGSWRQAWSGVKGVVKNAVNGMIDLLNSLLEGIGNALNSIVKAANSLSFSIPEWMPVIGGKSFHPNLRTVKVPTIPALASGAVLPANRPFMAVVGDQRHGTNIEAPLDTIRTAMAEVMADATAGNMAGFNATAELLRQILQAVLGIELGDRVIGEAARRYEGKMAMMKGV